LYSRGIQTDVTESMQQETQSTASLQQ
jgi:hypothetical protein